jgi:tetratricopeptide (TPR) repeat protein
MTTGLARRRPSGLYFFRFSLGVVVLAGFSSTLWSAWTMNAWSLQYLLHSLGQRQSAWSLTPAPQDQPRASLWLARTAIMEGNLPGALALVHSLANQGDRDALRIQGQALESQGDYPAAVQTWMGIRDANSLWNSGKRAIQENRFEDALLAYRTLYVLDPESVTLPLADLLQHRRKDIAAAESILRQSLEERPDSPERFDWLVRLGDALRAQARWDEAETVYRQALDLQRDSWAIHIGLGWVHHFRGDGLGAVLDEFHRAIVLDPARGDGYFAIGELLTREGRNTEADAWFREALARSPNDYGLWSWRIYSAHSGGNIPLALQVSQEALARFPNCGECYLEMAFAYRGNQQRQEAAAAVERALVLLPDSGPGPYARAGQIFEWAGEKEKALGSYRRALALDPTNDVARRGVESLVSK